VEPNEIDILAFTVLRNLEQINEAQEARLPRQRRSNIGKTDRLNRIHFDLALFHSVAVAHFYVGTRPYSDTASDFSSTNSIAKSLGKHHEESLHAAMVGGGRL
jgi:hypothetical protein